MDMLQSIESFRHPRVPLRLLISLLLVVGTLLGANLACAIGGGGVDTSYAPDGSYLHEVIKPASGRKHLRYAVLLCKAADIPVAPYSVAVAQKMFLKDGQGTGNVYDYFLNMSYGSVDLDRSVVFTGYPDIVPGGWFTMTTPKATLDLRNNSPTAPANRSQTDLDCQAAAGKYGFFRGDWDGVVDIINIVTDSGQANGTNVVAGYPTDANGTKTQALSFFAHEMGHALGLNHSMLMNLDSGPVHTWSPGGDAEYLDTYDTMGGAYVSGRLSYTIPYPAYQLDGPEMEAFHRYQLGWMPDSRVYTYPGSGRAPIVLAATSDPRTPGSLMAKIPVSAKDSKGEQDYYTVEFRRPINWDAGIPHDTVLIHEIREGSTDTTHLRSYLVRRKVGLATSDPWDSYPLQGATWMPGQVFQDTANKIRISIDKFANGTASITISNDVGTAPGSGSGGDDNCDPTCGPYVNVTSPVVSSTMIPVIRADGHSFALSADVNRGNGPDVPDSSVIWSKYTGAGRVSAESTEWAQIGTGRSLSTTLPAGDYTLKVSALSSIEGRPSVSNRSDGQSWEQMFPVHVCDTTKCAPHVSIDQPTSGTHVPSGISFTLSGSATATDDQAIPDGNYTWTANGHSLGSGKTITTSLSTAGTSTITLSATDTAGYSGTATTTITVDPPTAAPAVTITKPLDGATFSDVPAGGITVDLAASGSSGITNYAWSSSVAGAGGSPTPLGTGQTLSAVLKPTSTVNCAITTLVVQVVGSQPDGQKATASITVLLRVTCIR